MTTTPLTSFRVLDLTNVLAGLFCCHQMAHPGVEVIEVEVPGSGDLARQLGAAPDLNVCLMGVSCLAQNSGKRSVTLNLKSDARRVVFERLVTIADVLVENFRPGVMDRLSVGYPMADTIDDLFEALECERNCLEARALSAKVCSLLRPESASK